MPAEPDSRTDIYSLGILFWTMLTQQPAFSGETPMDIIQSVLGRRLPSVSSIRFDVPDVIARIIQKMTMKAINDRYHSASGLRHDLVEVRRLLGAGDAAALRHVSMNLSSITISSLYVWKQKFLGNAPAGLKSHKPTRGRVEQRDRYFTPVVRDSRTETFLLASCAKLDS